MKSILNVWPWYIAGPLIGLFVPVLLVFGNKLLGISSSFQHICSILLTQKSLQLPATMHYQTDGNFSLLSELLLAGWQLDFSWVRQVLLSFRRNIIH